MEQDRVQRYVKSLERTIENNHHYLKESIEDFQEMCRRVSPEKNIPTGITVDIREMYKEIRDRMAEIKAIEQLLQGKYRQYYRRDALRDKEIAEFGFVAKNVYSKFEYTLVQIQAIRRLKEHAPKEDRATEPPQWFRSQENQVGLIKNLRMLAELDYEPTPGGIEKERRDLTGGRTLTLFLINGDSLSLDILQSKIRLREHDIIERYNQEEVRGVLAHLRNVDPHQVETKFRQFMENEGLARLKCLFLSARSPKDLEGDLLRLIETTLQEMTEGELRTLSI